MPGVEACAGNDRHRSRYLLDGGAHDLRVFAYRQRIELSGAAGRDDGCWRVAEHVPEIPAELLMSSDRSVLNGVTGKPITPCNFARSSLGDIVILLC